MYFSEGEFKIPKITKTTKINSYKNIVNDPQIIYKEKIHYNESFLRKKEEEIKFNKNLNYQPNLSFYKNFITNNNYQPQPVSESLKNLEKESLAKQEKDMITRIKYLKKELEKKWKTVFLDENTHISFIEKLDNEIGSYIHELVISKSTFSNINFVKYLKNLTKLTIISCPFLESIKGVEYCTNLSEVLILNTNIKSVTPLLSSYKLRKFQTNISNKINFINVLLFPINMDVHYINLFSKKFIHPAERFLRKLAVIYVTTETFEDCELIYSKKNYRSSIFQSIFNRSPYFSLEIRDIITILFISSIKENILNEFLSNVEKKNSSKIFIEDYCLDIIQCFLDCFSDIRFIKERKYLTSN